MTDLALNVLGIVVIPLLTIVLSIIFQAYSLKLQKQKLILEKLFDKKYEVYNNLVLLVLQFHSDKTLRLADLELAVNSARLVTTKEIADQLYHLINQASACRDASNIYMSNHNEDTSARYGEATNKYVDILNKVCEDMRNELEGMAK